MTMLGLVERPGHLRRRQSRRLRFMRVVYVQLDQNGEWPLRDDLSFQFLNMGLEFELRRDLARLPDRLGGGAEDRVALTVRGLVALSEAQDLLNDFLLVLRLGVRRCRAVRKPVIRLGDLVSDLGLEAGRARAVMAVFESEGLTAPASPDGPWDLIPGEVGVVAGVGCAKDYVVLRARAKRERLRHRFQSAVRELVGRVFRPDSSFWEKLATGVAILVISTVGALVVRELVDDDAGGPADPGPNPVPRRVHPAMRSGILPDAAVRALADVG